MRVCIAGATGFIGGHLCDECIGRGYEVVALVRKPSPDLARKGVTQVTGDLADEDALCHACTGAEAVFNVTGTLGTWGAPPDELEAVNAKSAGILVECAARAGAGRVVHTSTAGVSGPLPMGVRASENYSNSPATEYQKTKMKGERAAAKAHAETGMPLTIVRPTFVYGPGDMHKLPLFRSVAKGRMVLVNGGRSSLHPVYVDDLVAGMLLASEKSSGWGEAYILGGERPATVRELLSAVARAVAAPAPSLSVPGGLLLAAAGLSEAVGRLSGREPALTRSRIKLFSENYAYSIERAKSDLGYKPMVSLAEGVKLTADWYRAHRHIRR
ncbi:MAG: NAD-dependent epimerase/dehydratase family protein [Armatimonadota bacterium]